MKLLCEQSLLLGIYMYLLVYVQCAAGLSYNIDSVCEDVTVPLCLDLPYNKTIFPNMLNQQTQEEAGLEVHQFYPLVRVGCSDVLKMFLCSVYVPVCTVLARPVPPCRSLCDAARAGCEPLMNRFGFDWPERLQCSQFPQDDGDALCILSPDES